MMSCYDRPPRPVVDLAKAEKKQLRKQLNHKYNNGN